MSKSANVPKEEASEGAFAKIDTPKDTVFSLYSGYLLNSTQKEALKNSSDEMVKKAQEEYPNDPTKVRQLAERMWMYRYSILKCILSYGKPLFSYPPAETGEVNVHVSVVIKYTHN